MKNPKYHLTIEADDKSTGIADDNIPTDDLLVEILIGTLSGVCLAVSREHNCGNWNCHTRQMTRAINKFLDELQDEHKKLDEHGH